MIIKKDPTQQPPEPTITLIFILLLSLVAILFINTQPITDPPAPTPTPTIVPGSAIDELPAVAKPEPLP